MAKPIGPDAQTAKDSVRKPYHHGDLRRALKQAAETMLTEQGLDAFTLRECARRAGVSHGAPAHHFGDVGGLLADVAADGFEALTGRMDSYAGDLSDPLDRLIAIGQAYIDHALAAPGQFRVMFHCERVQEDWPRRQAAADACFQRLLTAIQGCFPQAESQTQLLGAWSVVHGFAELALTGSFDAMLAGRSRAAFAQAEGGAMLRQWLDPYRRGR